MRVLKFFSVLLMAAGISVGTLVITESPALAACSYHDYGISYPQRAGVVDTGIWISLRRQATSTGDCNFYAVVRNVRREGRDVCYFAVSAPNGLSTVPSCPILNDSRSTGTVRVELGQTATARLTVKYLAATPKFPAGTYIAEMSRVYQ